MLRGGDEDLAAEVAALLLARELILPVDAGGAGVDHALHELEGVERTTEAGLGVGDDRDHPVLDGADALGVLDLIGAHERVVNPTDDRGNRVRRVDRLVRVRVAGEVRVGGDLPAGEVDGLEAGLDLLDGLVAGQRAEGVDEVEVVDLLPELLGSAAGQRVLFDHRAAQLDDILGRVLAGDSLPAGVGGPVAADRFDVVQFVRRGVRAHDVSLLCCSEVRVIHLGAAASPPTEESGKKILASSHW